MNRLMGWYEELECDIPAMWIVDLICAEPDRFGVVRPGDVSWHHVSRCLRGTLYSMRCWCNRPLPPIKKNKLYSPDGKQVWVAIGQCEHCRKIFWEKVEQW